MSLAIETQGMELFISRGKRASGSVTLTTGLAADEGITIAGHLFAFKTSGATGDQAAIYGSLAESAKALADKINESATVGIAGVVSASSSAAVVTVTAAAPGTGGNSTTFTATGAHVTAITGSGFLASGAGTDYVKVLEVSKLDGPNESAKQYDVTSFDSVSREKRPALKDTGDITFTVNWIPTDAGHQALHAALADRTLDDYKIVYTDDPASQATFKAFVTGHSPKGALDAQMTMDCTLTVTGDVTYTPGA